jgi:hypothetical protein
LQVFKTKRGVLMMDELRERVAVVLGRKIEDYELWTENIIELCDKMEDFEKRTIHLRKALEFYAERRHFTEWGVEQGGIARKALEGEEN